MKLKSIFCFLFCQFTIITIISAQQKNQNLDSKFSFIAFGDMPYFVPEDFTRFEQFIQHINAQNQEFNVFVGDIKSSKTECTNELYHKIYNYFESFKKPLIYTPGDNEWTDCAKSIGQQFDPLERLAALRSIFFNQANTSLGKQKMNMESESANIQFARYVENKAWEMNNIAFATIHIVGSNNNFNSENRNFTNEYFDRNDANIFWINDVFRKATSANNKGIVLFVHADMFYPFTDYAGSSGFKSFLKQLKILVQSYNKPVMLVHGDSHKFIIDKPMLDIHGKTILNFTRVQVFGEMDMHAVQIKVNPDNPQLFEVQELIVPFRNL